MRIAIIALVVGCYQPSARDCAFQCATGTPQCPSGSYCDPALNLCRPEGKTGPCSAGGDGGCMSPQTMCPGGSCANLMNDPQNCGACGVPCASGVCQNGKCGRRVFVTNEAPLIGGFVTAGSATPDAYCQRAADTQMIGGTWNAWVTTVEGVVSSPSMRLVKPGVDDDVPYVLLNGKVIASNWIELTDGGIDYPINITEFGTPVGGGITTAVWTNTSTSGQAVSTQNDGTTCFNFTIQGSTYTVAVGRLDYKDMTWTNVGPGSCYQTPAHLYCFEK